MGSKRNLQESCGVFEQNTLGAWTKFSNHKKIAEPHCMSDAARENLYVNVKASNWVSGHLLFPGSLDNNHPIPLCFHKTVDSWLHFLSVNAYITCCIG